MEWYHFLIIAVGILVGLGVGFGLGIGRLTMLLCGLPIKEAEFLFRGPNRLTP